MVITDFIANVNDRIKDAIDTANRVEAIRLTEVLIGALQDKVRDWKQLLEAKEKKP